MDVVAIRSPHQKFQGGPILKKSCIKGNKRVLAKPACFLSSNFLFVVADCFQVADSSILTILDKT